MMLDAILPLFETVFESTASRIQEGGRKREELIRNLNKRDMRP